MLITEAEVEIHMQTVQYIISDELAREVLFRIIQAVFQLWIFFYGQNSRCQDVKIKKCRE